MILYITVTYVINSDRSMIYVILTTLYNLKKIIESSRIDNFI